MESIMVERKHWEPYETLTKVVWNTPGLKNLPECARLQYFLLLDDGIIRAKVFWTKKKTSIIYNPAVTTTEKLQAFLESKGVQPTLVKEITIPYQKLIDQATHKDPEALME